MPREKVTSEHLEVMLLGSGYAAVHVVTVSVLNEAGEVVSEYPDIQQTGIGRYAHREQAAIEARMWSRSDKLEYHE